MKRMYCICIALLFMLFQAVSAQEVTTVGGYPVIDLSEMATLRTSTTDPSLKFQVMRTNLNGTTMPWANAISNCASYSGDGGGSGSWRLPTQRELQMIWILHTQLKGINGFTAFSASRYWSSTESSANDAWAVNFGIGNVTNNNKASSYYVRCVRDLP